ncbi:hypothetical protein C8K30_105241 [Promicromonospora sp. AC04]|uniref:DUF6153 family protein n=1 Tax=Promicromonospora sp. AC04 TaxID=2135723 RepID=UPI000D35928E|nr:DUF6153 family protein [Promicromonospora sp. AC04]PUB27010.1 hypothetical protein C8K30_105241 [Promicromonospora sp. AC04]
MPVISLLRSAVAEPGRRLNGALVILTVIIGVVTMHSMSGSPTLHQHRPHGASVVAALSASVDGMPPTVTQADHVKQDPAEPAGSCCEGCGGHDAAMAMCLMILVALLALVVPVRRLLWRALLALSVPLAQVVTDLRAVTAPSLHELCISRT